MVRVHAPGPKYALPSTTGFLYHDPTRTQAPAYSFGVVTKGSKIKTSAPGPKYDVRGYSEHGKLTTRQAVLFDRWKTSKFGRTPGPKSYDPKVTLPNPPAYSIGNKRPDMRKSKVGPGPNKYLRPPCIGPQIPDIKAEPAFSILGRNFPPSTKRQVPGPKYMLPENNVYLKTPPRVALLGRHQKKYHSGIPGPKYLPKPPYEKPEGLKGISFGVKHSPEKHLPMMPEDRIQEAFVF